MKGRAAIALVLAVILTLILAASASAGKPFPRIAPDAAVSCSQAKAKVSVAIAWKKANRKGIHRGHAVALVRGKGGKIHHRKVKSRGLRGVRSQSIEHRFRFPKRASRRLCKGKAKAEVVTSHGHDKDRAGLVEIYRVTRKTLGGKASASGDTRTLGASGSGPADPMVTDAVVATGSDCLGGGANAIIKAGAQLQACDLSYAVLTSADLENANLTSADLSFTNLSSANFLEAILTDANLTRADLSNANLFLANLPSANLFGAALPEADLSFANLTDATLVAANLKRANLFNANLIRAALFNADLSFANLDRANCWGAEKPDGSLYSRPSDGFVQC